MIYVVLAGIFAGLACFFACLGFRWLAEEWSASDSLPEGAEVGGPGSSLQGGPDLPDFPACDKWTLIALGARARFK